MFIVKVIFIIIFGYSLTFAAQDPDTLKSITVEEVKEKIENKEDIVLLDVRSLEEYEGSLGHLDSSILIPIDQLLERIEELNKFKGNQIIVLCKGGFRSRRGTQILNEAGFNALDMQGGMLAYREMEEEIDIKVKVDTVSGCDSSAIIKDSGKDLESGEQ